MSRAYRARLYDLGRQHLPDLNVSRMTLKDLESKLLEYKVAPGAPRGGISIPYPDKPGPNWARGLFPTGYVDVDYEILFRIPFETLKSFFFLNKYFHSFLFTNQEFWYRKIEEHFGVPFPPPDPSHRPLWTYQRQYSYFKKNDKFGSLFATLDIGDRTMEVVQKLQGRSIESSRVVMSSQGPLPLSSYIISSEKLSLDLLAALGEPSSRLDVLEYLIEVVKTNPGMWRSHFVKLYLPRAWIRGDPQIVNLLNARRGFELSSHEFEQMRAHLFKKGSLKSICLFLESQDPIQTPFYKTLFLRDLAGDLSLDQGRPLGETLKILSFVLWGYEWRDETPGTLVKIFTILGFLESPAIETLFRQTERKIPPHYRKTFLWLLSQECPPRQPLLGVYFFLGLYPTEEALRQGLYLSASHPRRDHQRFKDFLDLIEEVGCLENIAHFPFSWFLPYFSSKFPTYALEFFARVRKFWISMDNEIWIRLVTGYLTYTEYSPELVLDLIKHLATQYKPLGFTSDNLALILVGAIITNHETKHFLDLEIYDYILSLGGPLETEDLEKILRLNHQKGSPESFLYGTKLIGLLYRHALRPKSPSLEPFWERAIQKTIIRKEHEALESLIVSGMSLMSSHHTYLNTRLSKSQKGHIMETIARGRGLRLK